MNVELSNGQFDLLWEVWQNGGRLFQDEIPIPPSKNKLMEKYTELKIKCQIRILIRKHCIRLDNEEGRNVLVALIDKEAYFFNLTQCFESPPDHLDTSSALLIESNFSNTDIREFTKEFFFYRP